MGESFHYLECVQGNDFSLVISLVTDIGLNLDLGDFGVAMEIKRTRASTSTLISSLDETNGGVVVDRINDTLTLFIPAAETLGMTVGTYYYEILFTTLYEKGGIPARESFRMIEGKFEITEPVV